jgi:hypothetical protein
MADATTSRVRMHDLTAWAAQALTEASSNAEGPPRSPGLVSSRPEADDLVASPVT